MKNISHKKRGLLSQLENVKNNYILVLASISLFSNQKSYLILDESYCELGKDSIEFKQVSNMMKKESDRNIACEEFAKMGLRNLIKEAFELIKDYSNNTNQEQTFKSQNWYHFARIIRNCLSHNFKFQFSSPSLKLQNTSAVHGYRHC